MTRRLPGTLQHEEQTSSLNVNGPSSDQNPENLHIGLSLTPDIQTEVQQHKLTPNERHDCEVIG
ncbi:unnamed protein product [Schistosoma margrebowiei]|uniref:Uncharacterized protein n=1 Tax=Schistosoma margrebowiei TaxID=48269 RepID=A0A3P8B4K3_9TREM|nr:unnamed protein product [Schistosoma margrebowiei]